MEAYSGDVAGRSRAARLWPLEDLCKEPEVTWLERQGVVRSLTYPGEPFGGRPTRVFAYYGVPRQAQGRLPAMVLVHGGGGRAFADWAMAWVRRGYVALAMDLTGHGPDGERLPDGGPEQDHDQIFHTMKNGLTETWPYHAVAAVIRGVSVLAAQPEVDPDHIGITGISWGGYLTCIVSGLDARLKVSIPVYGCGYLYENSAWLPIFKEMPVEERQQWIEYFDPSRHLPAARMPMLWVNGTNDFAYPLDSYQRSYWLPGGPRALCIKVNMSHGHEPGWAPFEIALYADQHLRQGIPLPTLSAMQCEGQLVTAEVSAPLPLMRAAIHYTGDTGPWQQRAWCSMPARIEAGRVIGELPDRRPLVCFLTVTDERDATVSTEHVVLEG